MLAVDQIATVLQQNLLEQWGITSAQLPVLYGRQFATQPTGQPRVIVAMAPAWSTGPAMGDHAPGPEPTEPTDTTYARTLYTRIQDVTVWVYGPGAPSAVADSDVARWQEEACAVLMHQVSASLWETGGGGCEPDGAIVVTGGDWLTLESADMRHGAAVRMDCKVRIPMLDRPIQRLRLTLPLTTTAVYSVNAVGDEELVTVVGPPLPPPP